jgi:hypothetical protein
MWPQSMRQFWAGTVRIDEHVNVYFPLCVFSALEQFREIATDFRHRPSYRINR